MMAMIMVMMCLQPAVLSISFAVQTVAVSTRVGDAMEVTIVGTIVTNATAVRLISTYFKIYLNLLNIFRLEYL